MTLTKKKCCYLQKTFCAVRENYFLHLMFKSRRKLFVQNFFMIFSVFYSVEIRQISQNELEKESFCTLYRFRQETDRKGFGRIIKIVFAARTKCFCASREKQQFFSATTFFNNFCFCFFLFATNVLFKCDNHFNNHTKIVFRNMLQI